MTPTETSEPKILDLSGQLLTSIPASVCQQVTLEELELDRNLLRSLPANIGQLSKLKKTSEKFI